MTIIIDGRKFSGTPLQIVQAMQSIAFEVKRRTIGEYIDWVVDNTRSVEGLELKVAGNSDKERAESLVSAMIETGLATK